MAFYRPDPEMASRLETLMDELSADGRPGLRNSLAVTWIRYADQQPDAGQGVGAGWNEERLLYPASVVKLFYAVAVERWLQQDLIPESDELQRALRDMIGDSSNDATGLVMDLLTGTSSGPALQGTAWELWQRQMCIRDRAGAGRGQLLPENLGGWPLWPREAVLWGGQRQPQRVVHPGHRQDAGSRDDRGRGVSSGLPQASGAAGSVAGP